MACQPMKLALEDVSVIAWRVQMVLSDCRSAKEALVPCHMVRVQVAYAGYMYMCGHAMMCFCEAPTSMCICGVVLCDCRSLYRGCICGGQPARRIKLQCSFFSLMVWLLCVHKRWLLYGQHVRIALPLWFCCGICAYIARLSGWRGVCPGKLRI
jgi:hypothetical protein